MLKTVKTVKNDIFGPFLITFQTPCFGGGSKTPQKGGGGLPSDPPKKRLWFLWGFVLEWILGVLGYPVNLPPFLSPFSKTP